MGSHDTTGLDRMSFEPITFICDILKNWYAILLGAIGAALLTAVLVSARYEPIYTTSATFVVTMKNNANTTTYWSKAYEMAETMKLVLESNSMNRIICEELGVDSVDADITTSTVGTSNLLILQVTSDTSKRAMDVIRVVMDNYAQVSFYAMGVTTMEVLQEPTVPMYPSNSLNVKRPAGKAFLIAGAALVCLFGLVSYLNDTIKMEQDIEKKLDASSLGQIPYQVKNRSIKELFKRDKSALLINNPLTAFAFVESYRKLAIKVEHRLKKKEKNALVITSIAENEGKSTVAANLAIALASQSKRVILIEGDLRRPSQFLIFGKSVNENQEIGEYLKGNTQLQEILMKCDVPNLYLILGRNCYSTSTEMINKVKMRNLIEQSKKAADYVIIDTPPVGLIGDAEIFARYAGAVMLVTKQNYMPAEEINDVLDVFRGQEASVVGVVLNKVLSVPGTVDIGTYGKYGR